MKSDSILFWSWLVEPSSSIYDFDERRRVRLFTSVQLVITLALLPMALRWVPIQEGHDYAPFVWLFWAQVAAYFVSRTRFYKVGVMVSLLSMLAMGIHAAATAVVFSSEAMALYLMWSVVPLLYGSMVFSPRVMLMLSAAVILAYLSLPVLIPGTLLIHVAPVTFFVGIWSIAHNLLLRYNEMGARERREEVEATAVQLTQSNALLQAEIGERTAAEARIEASLQEKEVLLKEIHHRVKNNLQVISSLLNLQAGYVAENANREIFFESQNRVRSMALIHEKLYQSQDLSRIDFAEYARNLTAVLAQSYGHRAAHVALAVQADEIYLSVETAVPCGLILNELVSNAFKHAFPDGRSGNIDIELRQNGADEISLRVSDNGVGLPPDVDYLQSSSLGLQLVQTLAGQINGRFQHENCSGSAFTLTFMADVR